MPRTLSDQRRKASETQFPRGHPGQSSLDFDATLIDRYPTFLSVVRAAVTKAGKEYLIAAAVDMSPTEFCRRMADSPSDPGHPYPLRKFEDLLDAIDPSMIIEWLVAKYMRDPEAERAQALATIANASRQLERALKVLGDDA